MLIYKTYEYPDEFDGMVEGLDRGRIVTKMPKYLEKIIDDYAKVRKATIRGDLPALKWLVSQPDGRFVIDNMSLFCAVRHRHLDILEWAHKNSILDWQLFCLAAGNGDFEAVKWAHENKLIWPKPEDGTLCSYAASSGRLDLLQWLVSMGYGLDGFCTTQAARWGHIDVLEWLLEHGCPWNIQTCIDVMIMYPTATLQWIEKNREKFSRQNQEVGRRQKGKLW